MRSPKPVLSSKERRLSTLVRKSNKSVHTYKSPMSSTMCYLSPSSISDPFKQDRIGLQTDERWARIFPHRMEQEIVWADHVQKLSRADAKVSRGGH